MAYSPGDDKELDELMKKVLARMARDMDDGMPTSDYHGDFDRSVQITDGESLLKLQQLNDIKTEGEMTFGRLKMLKNRAEIARYELFELLHKAYPKIRKPERMKIGEETASTGWRFWHGDAWYVGHDVRNKDKGGKTAEERGEGHPEDRDLPPTSGFGPDDAGPAPA